MNKQLKIIGVCFDETLRKLGFSCAGYSVLKFLSSMKQKMKRLFGFQTYKMMIRGHAIHKMLGGHGSLE